jgi:hypothetical protein
MDCDGDQLRDRTERGGCAVTMGGVRLNGEQKNNIDGSSILLDGGRDGTTGKTCIRRPWLTHDQPECYPFQ